MLEAERSLGHHESEAVLRSLSAFRNNLPAEARMQMATILEWAREGITHGIGDDLKPELQGLRTASAHARDILLASVIKEGA